MVVRYARSKQCIDAAVLATFLNYVGSGQLGRIGGALEYGITWGLAVTAAILASGMLLHFPIVDTSSFCLRC